MLEWVLVHFLLAIWLTSVPFVEFWCISDDLELPWKTSSFLIIMVLLFGEALLLLIMVIGELHQLSLYLQ